MKHLWECNHAYCGPNSGYNSDSYHDSFDDFVEEYGNPEFFEDLNVVYRFDWDIGDEVHEDEDGTKFPLTFFMVLPRKERFWVAHVKVTAEDESEVIEWLKARFEYMKKLWEPIA